MSVTMPVTIGKWLVVERSAGLLHGASLHRHHRSQLCLCRAQANQVGQIAEPMIKTGQPITITSEAQVVTLQDYYSGCELEVNLDSGNNYHLTGCIPAQKDKPWPLIRRSGSDGLGDQHHQLGRPESRIDHQRQGTVGASHSANLVELAHVPSAPLASCWIASQTLR